MEMTLDNLIEWMKDPVVLLVFGIVFATVLMNFAMKLVFDRLQNQASHTRTVWDDALLGSVRGPLTMLIWVVGIAWAAQI
ncbi:MAG TPA: hypothetical protein VJ998_11730, partial [Pseudomonadales bacterium]|nr:hypothetical protein [Pseudomonadales bacterium]